MPYDGTSQWQSWMTLDQAAERTGRSVELLRRWCRQKRIPAMLVGRTWVILEADLALIDAMPRKPWKGKRA